MVYKPKFRTEPKMVEYVYRDINSGVLRKFYRLDGVVVDGLGRHQLQAGYTTPPTVSYPKHTGKVFKKRNRAPKQHDYGQAGMSSSDLLSIRKRSLAHLETEEQRQNILNNKRKRRNKMMKFNKVLPPTPKQFVYPNTRYVKSEFAQS
jgi:hypothetical protein